MFYDDIDTNHYNGMFLPQLSQVDVLLRNKKIII